MPLRGAREHDRSPARAPEDGRLRRLPQGQLEDSGACSDLELRTVPSSGCELEAAAWEPHAMNRVMSWTMVQIACAAWLAACSSGAKVVPDAGPSLDAAPSDFSLDGGAVAMKASAVATGRLHSCGLATSGAVSCWGDDT